MGRKTKEKDMVEYICPKCRTKIAVEKGKRVPSLYCKNCLKSKQLTMLRLIYQKTDQSNKESTATVSQKGIKKQEV